MFRPFEWAVGDRTLSNADRTLVMGIVNVTPDSFSDGGALEDAGAAVERGLAMVAAGADIVDVGGESTRPGAARVPVDEELRRVIPVVAQLADSGAVVSIDTSKPVVAEAAALAGAVIINDVSGLRSAQMVQVAAEHRVGVVIMHMQGTPEHMQKAPEYSDVVGEVEAFLRNAAVGAIAGGVAPNRLAIDPGISFGKTTSHNLKLLDATGRFSRMGYPVVVGISRKRFLGDLAGIDAAEDRDGVSAVLGAHLAATGAGILRVHSVTTTRLALSVVDPLLRVGNDA